MSCRLFFSCLRVASFALLVTLGWSGGLMAAEDKQPVSFRAVVAPGAEPLLDAIFRITPQEGADRQEVEVRAVEGAATIDLSAGWYRVIASSGQTEVERRIVVGDSPTVHEISLNAGKVLLKLIRNVGGETLNNGVAWEVLTYGKDSQGKRQQVATSSAAQPKFLLPEGFYLARATIGKRDVKHTIEVTAGATFKYTLILQ